jgi:hypothetical protein
MSDLPYSDPSNPALPSPLFSDITAVRGDHMRANNAAIFADLIALNTRNPELVALTSGSFKTAALANANTYNGRSFFTCTAGVSDTPSTGAWLIIGYWNPTDSSGRFVCMSGASLETWEIKYSGGVWGTWTQLTDASGNVTRNVTGDVTGDVTGGVTGDVTGDVTGNADTATQADGIKETGAAAAVVHKKIVEIGDWNMNTLTNVNIPHGLTLSKIIAVNILIRDDSGLLYPLTHQTSAAEYDLSNGWYHIGATIVSMFIRSSGWFGSYGYSSTSYNRGWITIEYVD